jgi:hypothetical protein
MDTTDQAIRDAIGAQIEKAYQRGVEDTIARLYNLDLEPVVEAKPKPKRATKAKPRESSLEPKQTTVCKVIADLVNTQDTVTTSEIYEVARANNDAIKRQDVSNAARYLIKAKVLALLGRGVYARPGVVANGTAHV